MGLTPSQMHVAVRPLYDIVQRNLHSSRLERFEDDKDVQKKVCCNCKQSLTTEKEISNGYCEPCEIARIRYVKGEIPRKEYFEIMKVLREP